MNDKVIAFPADGMRSVLWMFIASVLFVGAILGALAYFGLHAQLVLVLQWTEVREFWAPVLFPAIMAAVVVFLLPGVFFTTVAGEREIGRSTLEWVLYGAGFAGTVVAVIYLGYIAGRALARYEINADQELP